MASDQKNTGKVMGCHISVSMRKRISLPSYSFSCSLPESLSLFFSFFQSPYVSLSVSYSWICEQKHRCQMLSYGEAHRGENRRSERNSGPDSRLKPDNFQVSKIERKSSHHSALVEAITPTAQWPWGKTSR